MSKISSHALCNIKTRSKLFYAIEKFFQEREYVSVHTPVRSDWLIPERHIDVYACLGEQNKSYLTPSPEIYLKTLLSNIEEPINIYEIAHAFRKEEIQDNIHDDEFIMLEWYTQGASLQGSIEITQELLQCISCVLVSNRIEHNRILTIPPCILRMQDAFAKFADIDLHEFILQKDAITAAKYVGLDMNVKGYDWEDIFHRVLIDKVEPKLPQDRVVYLTEYPSRVHTLAKTNGDGIWSERWEMYIQGVEVANCYVEEFDSDKILLHMEEQIRLLKSTNNVRPRDIPYNREYLTNNSLGNYSGVAMGLDRLIKILLSAENLAEVSTLSLLQR